jgi:hypothetical protein
MKWKIFETRHYIFHYFPILAEEEIEKIARGQETIYCHILSYLGLKNHRMINYFLYPTNQIKGSMMGDDGNGNTNREKFEIHAVYNEEVKCVGAHEDTHLLSLPLGLSVKLFREGLAEFMSETWHGKTHDIWANKFLNEKKIPKLSKIIDDAEWDKVSDLISYPCAGSFIKYLIESLGKEKFINIYKRINKNKCSAENLATILAVSGKSLDQLEDEWKDKLQKISR